tara:strand:+ start:240 stop:449 length:210 start_codon:yes stop_codon:yes gene_type:complete
MLQFNDLITFLGNLLAVGQLKDYTLSAYGMAKERSCPIILKHSMHMIDERKFLRYSPPAELFNTNIFLK